MNSLNRYRPAKQFRCKPLVGNAPFGYEEIVHSADGSHNYQTPADVVGAFAEVNERGREEWLKLTAGLKTAGESPSVLSAGNQKAIALSICGLATPISASAHSTFSNVISGKQRG